VEEHFHRPSRKQEYEMTKQIYFEDVGIGQALPVLKKHPTSRQLVQWAGAAEEFYELHYDKDFAISKGFPGVIVHGQLMASFLAQLVTDWIGDEGSLKKFKVSYLAITYPGYDLLCKGNVTRKSVENGENLVTCEIWMEKENGEKVLTGEAVASLPNK
jgi:acyl dehydratase